MQVAILRVLHEEFGAELDGYKLGPPAAERGHLHVLEYLRDRGVQLYDSNVGDTMASGAKKNTAAASLVANFLHEHYPESLSTAMIEAARHGNLVILRYMHEVLGLRLDNDFRPARAAVVYNQPEIIRYLLSVEDRLQGENHRTMATNLRDALERPRSPPLFDRFRLRSIGTSYC